MKQTKQTNPRGRAHFRMLPVAMALAAVGPAWADLNISNAPLTTGQSVPPNVMLVLSNERSASVLNAYSGEYDPKKRYLGYFDPETCYDYSGGFTRGKQPVSTRLAGVDQEDFYEINEYFYKVGGSLSRICSNDTFSGNYMNWASARMIDVLRLVLTGGDRDVDKEDLTILQAARLSSDPASDDESFFPDKTINTAGTGATPFSWSKLRSRVTGYSTESKGEAELTPFTQDHKSDGRVIQFSDGSDNFTYTYMLRIKVCDPSGASEYRTQVDDLQLCQKYPGNNKPTYKPVGLLQKYADKVRFGLASYRNSSKEYSGPDGILRARMKFIGEKMIVPDEADTVDNPQKEWDPKTGIYHTNPDTTDAENSGVEQSGVINYLNKFDKDGRYKVWDPIAELYYVAQLAMRNVEPPEKYTENITESQKGGFPVITTKVTESWDEFKHKLPIQYRCQKTHFLGFSDSNTFVDTYLPGNTLGTEAYSSHDGAPTDTAIDDIMALTEEVGTLEGYPPGGNLAEKRRNEINTYYVAGLAYWANTQDMLPDDDAKPWTKGSQQAKTFFLDVSVPNPTKKHEYGNREHDYETSCTALATTPNLLYMAAKYGGFDHRGKPASEYATLLGDAGTWDRNGDCTPDNYFLTQQGDRMYSNLKSIFEEVTASNGVAATTTTSGMSANSSVLNAKSRLYISSYSNKDGWVGKLEAYELCLSSAGCPGASYGNPKPTAAWTASFTQDTAGEYKRVVKTQKGEKIVNFKILELSTEQEAALGGMNSSVVVDAVRRQPLGDIVNSGILYLNPGVDDYGWRNAASLTPGEREAYQTRMANAVANSSADKKETVVVGANDGMLHAFRASDGVERFAFVPDASYTYLKELANPIYTHRYFVDGTPVAGDIIDGGSWRSIVVTSTGAGGRSYFALDVENPDKPLPKWQIIGGDNSGESAVYPPSTPGFENLGVAIGKAAIVHTNSADHPWVVIFGNGYNSGGAKENGEAGDEKTPNRARLFIVDANSGALVKQISTGVGNSTTNNGLATPRVVDYDGNGTADAAYAGDLQGNLWKFDLKSKKVADWGVAFGGGSLIKATAPGDYGQPQPITAQPEVMRRKGHPGEAMVYVGTGRYFGVDDPSDTQVQTFYGVSDPCGNIDECGVTAAYAINDRGIYDRKENLTQYVLEQGTENTRTLTKGKSPTEENRGFYFDLVVIDPTDPTKQKQQEGTGERIIANVLTYYDRIFVNTLEPNSATDPCEGSTTSAWLYAIDPWTGAGIQNFYDNASSAYVSSVKIPGGSGAGMTPIGTRLFAGGESREGFDNKPAFPNGRRSWRQLQWK
ncbi:MAG: hypothetical protein LBO79_00305 [Zoogloeaceae bacterium]|jgi:type IV pilus assembly protein PilY1|nr:hypothetical protein [Zoogloeaceae bacterium]